MSIIVGSKRRVYEGTADRTAGGLTKEDLMKNKRGKIVSKLQHRNGLAHRGNLMPVSSVKGEGIKDILHKIEHVAEPIVNDTKKLTKYFKHNIKHSIANTKFRPLTFKKMFTGKGERPAQGGSVFGKIKKGAKKIGKPLGKAVLGMVEDEVRDRVKKGINDIGDTYGLSLGNGKSGKGVSGARPLRGGFAPLKDQIRPHLLGFPVRPYPPQRNPLKNMRMY